MLRLSLYFCLAVFLSLAAALSVQAQSGHSDTQLDETIGAHPKASQPPLRTEAETRAAQTSGTVAVPAKAARDTLPDYEFADRLDGLKVLVVDDEPDTRELLKAALEQCGAEVAAAKCAAEAIESIITSPPDLLISDIGMPEERV